MCSTVQGLGRAQRLVHLLNFPIIALIVFHKVAPNLKKQNCCLTFSVAFQLFRSPNNEKHDISF